MVGFYSLNALNADHFLCFQNTAYKLTFTAFVGIKNSMANTSVIRIIKLPNLTYFHILKIIFTFRRMGF